MSGQPRTGRVITRFGAEMVVEDDDGQLHRCTSRRRLEHAVCGDRVHWEPTTSGNDVVTNLLPRHNALTRPDLRGRPKAVAANVDQLIVVSAYRPEPNWEMVDRYLVAAALLPAAAVIVLNKADLCPSEDPAAGAVEEYRRIGYPVLTTSIPQDHGIEALEAACVGRTSILVGLSGVGKSSLIKALLPDQEVRIGEISEAIEKGRHTTTNATLYHLPTGGDLIDSPGVRDFDLGAVEPRDLARGFLEFADAAQSCRFHDCTHSVEPSCGVKAAVENGQISARRYRSYRLLLDARRAAG